MSIDRALKIQGWMEPHELEWLAQNASSCRRIVEIGSWKGRSARAMLDNSNARLVVVDWWNDPLELHDGTMRELTERGHQAIAAEWWANLSDELSSGRVVLVRGKSSDVVNSVWYALSRHPADFVFIDADHSFDGCLEDIVLYRGLVRPGGILAGHDYTTDAHPGVKKAVDGYFGDLAQQGPGSIWWVRA